MFKIIFCFYQERRLSIWNFPIYEEIVNPKEKSKHYKKKNIKYIFYAKRQTSTVE